MKLKIVLPLCGTLLVGCASDPPLTDEGAINLYRPGSEIKVDRQSEDIICVTEGQQKTCVPVVHEDETGDDQ